jgi:hypothetical protein
MTDVVSQSARVKTVPGLYIAAMLRVRVKEDLGKGILVGRDIRLTNNGKVISDLLTAHFQTMVGVLESRALLNASAVLFTATEEKFGEARGFPFIEKLTEFLYRARHFLLGLWLVKDNAADVELGFFELPHRGNPSQVTSNFIAAACTCADGRIRDTNFSLSELAWVGNLIDSSFKPEVESPVGAPQGVGRIGRALYLIQAARHQVDLGLKVAFYCMCLEALFSTSSAELAHKLSERVAYFLANEAETRVRVFEQVKEAYSVRSVVLHGDELPRKFVSKLESTSAFCDATLRSVLNLILGSPSVASVFQSSSDKLESYLRDLALGRVKPPSSPDTGMPGAGTA